MPSSSSRLKVAACAALGIAVGIAAAAGAQTQEAPTTSRESRSCFLPSQVNGFTSVDRDTVDVRIGTRQIYRLELTGICQDIDWDLRIGIRSTGGGSWVCQGLDAELISQGPIGLETCPVTSVRRLSDEEVEAERHRRH